MSRFSVLQMPLWRFAFKLASLRETTHEGARRPSFGHAKIHPAGIFAKSKTMRALP